MSNGLHFQQRRRIYKKHEPMPHPNKLRRVYDYFMYGVAILGPLSNLPQLFTIWTQKNAGEVSLGSWISYIFISLAWFGYGILHKEKPIIIMNIFLIITQALVVAGIIIYG